MFVIGTRGTSLERTVEQFHIRFEVNVENFARQMKTWGRGGFWQEYAIFFIVGIVALAVDIGQVYGLCSRYCWVWGQFNIIGKLTFAKRQV